MSGISNSPPAGTIVDRAYAEYTTNVDLTGTIPDDDTIPQNTEGTQIASVTITPKSTTNRLRIRATGFGSNATSVTAIILAVFSTAGGANALRATSAIVPASDYRENLVLEVETVPGSVSAQTISLRAGPGSGTMRLNGESIGRKFGGVSGVSLVVEEIAA